MRFDVLGPLQVRVDGVAMPLGPRKQRLLLAVMLCHRGDTLTTDHLIDVLWHGQPTRSARENLRGYVHGLRVVLGPHTVTGRGQPGYALVVEPDRLDSTQFVAAVVRGGEAVAAGEFQAGRAVLGSALDLWRGRPYQEFDEVPVLIAERERLAAYHLVAIEHRIDADLGLGLAAELVPELTDLVGRHRYRERFHAQLMLALYRSGRQADALAAYRHVHRLLAEDLGVDPQPELRQLHEAILRGDTTAHALRGNGSAATAASGGVDRPIPAQLPADVPTFTGRSGELAALTAALADVPADGQRGRSAVAAVAGSGGIGKTWLALRWAHEHRDRFPDGQLFVNLRGFDPSGEPMSPGTALRGFLDALGVPAGAIPADQHAQVGLYRSLVADRRMLIVLDNARDAEQVAGLLPGSATCAVIVTSRDRLTGLVTGHGARPVPVDVLADAQARQMLARRLDAKRLSAEPDAVEHLVAACGGLPLALAIAAARAAVAPHLALSVIAKELGDAGTRLGALDEDNPQASLRAVLSWSYLTLSTSRARMFALAGLGVGPDLSAPAAAALAGLPGEEVGELMRALQRQSLVWQHAPGRWRMHDLVRLYAAERAREDCSDDHRRLAQRRLVEMYLQTALAADRSLNPLRTPITVELSGAVDAPPAFADEAAALAWFSAEHDCLLAVQRLAADRGWLVAVWQLAWATSTFHRRCGHLHDEVAAWRAALPATQRLGDPAVMAEARRSLGEACALVGRHTEAAEHLGHALALAEAIGDLSTWARTQRALGYAYDLQRDYRRAYHHAAHALRLYRKLDHPARVTDALNSVGLYAARLGRHGPARTLLEAALASARQQRFRLAELAILDSLGFLEHEAGRPTVALTHYRQAMEMMRDLGHTYVEAELLEHIGDSHAALGEAEPAREAWRRSLRLYRSQHRTAAADRVRGRLC